MSKFLDLLDFFRIVIVLFSLYLKFTHSDVHNYNHMYEMYSIQDPFQLSGKGPLPEISEMNDCRRCPRVFYPVCSMKGVTYLNECVLKCAKKKMKREGPCLRYRRDGSSILNVMIPLKWKNFNDSSAISEMDLMENATIVFPEHVYRRMSTYINGTY